MLTLSPSLESGLEAEGVQFHLVLLVVRALVFRIGNLARFVDIVGILDLGFLGLLGRGFGLPLG